MKETKLEVGDVVTYTHSRLRPNNALFFTVIRVTPSGTVSLAHASTDSRILLEDIPANALRKVPDNVRG